MISRGSTQGAGRGNLRKREKTDGLLGLKTGRRLDQPTGKEKTNRLVGAKTWGVGRANLRKKEKKNGLVGAKNRGAGLANLRKKDKMKRLVGAKNRGWGRPT